MKYTGSRATGGRPLVFTILSVLSLLVGACAPAYDPHSNQLAAASSPYLREHADNPVHWQEWKEETLEFALKENKPIIVSIGYASCHWCHVMERESFMDTAVARIMNENFVCIKVDREERPDLDQVYMQAAELTSGNAGWPLNAFAMPDGKPFYAATYFPTNHWTSLLDQVLAAFKKDQTSLERQSRAIRDNIKRTDSLQFAVKSVEPTFAKDFLANVPGWTSYLDLQHGGLKGPSRFPMPAIGEFFLQYQHLTKDSASAQWVKLTLDEMAYGGIYDQIGGGFARYAIDSSWRVPHFEKMLYDNGQLVSLYAHAFQETGDSLYLRIINETLEFVSRELTSPQGAFYSSINADSEGEEGTFYIWTEDEIRKVVGEATDDMASVYGVTSAGNWENGKNIFYVGKEHRNEKDIATLDAARNSLLAARESRIRPSTDEKILASWNAMMLNGYLDAFDATGNQVYMDAALRNADFILNNLIKGKGRMKRALLEGTEGADGFLEDYAWTAKAFIHLYEVTFDIAWLKEARELADGAVEQFGKPGNALFYFASTDQTNPVSRKMEVFDNVIPSSNSVFAEVLFLLGEYFQSDEYIKRSNDAMAQALKNDPGLGVYLVNWARLAHMVTEGPYEVAVIGPEAANYVHDLQRRYLPTTLFMGGNEEHLPLLENKVTPNTTIYVCRNRVCKQPTTEVDEAIRQLGLE